MRATSVEITLIAMAEEVENSEANETSARPRTNALQAVAERLQTLKYAVTLYLFMKGFARTFQALAQTPIHSGTISGATIN